MRCRIIPKKKQSTGAEPVYLNVYDITSINHYAYWLGLGIFHSGIQVYGVEYGFGAHDNPTTGVFEVEPQQCPGFTFRKSILIGWTNMGAEDVLNLIDDISIEYGGNSYNLVNRNCNHFCDDVCNKLTGNYIPRWVNRLARVGQLCNCVLPAGVTARRVKQVTLKDNAGEDEPKHGSKTKRRYKNSCIPFCQQFNIL